MNVKYIDEKCVFNFIDEGRLLAKSPCFPKQKNIISRYFDIVLRRSNQDVEGDLSSFIKIQGDEVTFTGLTPRAPFVTTSSNISIVVGGKSSTHSWKVPSVVYKTSKHIIIAPTQTQLTLSKIIHCVAISIAVMFSIMSLLFAFLFGPIFFALSMIIIIPSAIASYLFFVKKSYISVGPIESICDVNVAEQTISIRGKFFTGVPSLLTRNIEATLYLGENVTRF